MKSTFVTILLIASFTLHLSAQEDNDTPIENQEKESEAFQNWEWFQEDFSADIQYKIEEYMKRFQEKFDSFDDDFGTHFHLDKGNMKKFEKLFEDFKIQFDGIDIPIDSIEHFFKDKEFKINDFEVQKFHFNPLDEELLEQFEERMKWYFEDEEFQEKINKYKQRQKRQIEEILEEFKERKISTKKAI